VFLPHRITLGQNLLFFLRCGVRGNGGVSLNTRDVFLNEPRGHHTNGVVNK